MNKTVYISGPISGLDFEQAFKSFEEKEIYLKEKGYDVVNPMKLSHNHDKTWKSYMKEDLKALIHCDYIYLLPGWTNSKGAIIEFNLAIDLGIKVL